MNKEINLLEEEVESVPQGTTLTRKQEILRIIEGLLMASGDPLPLAKMKEIIQTALPIRSQELVSLIETLRQSYQADHRGFQIDEIGGGYLLRTVKEVSPFVELLYHNRKGEKLSRAALEVLAIVAHKHPITRPQIEAIRGVDCSGTLTSLLERGLVEIVGKLETPGRPSQYGVTQRFLKHFGIKNIQDLTVLYS